MGGDSFRLVGTGYQPVSGGNVPRAFAREAPESAAGKGLRHPGEKGACRSESRLASLEPQTLNSPLNRTPAIPLTAKLKALEPKTQAHEQVRH